MTIAARTVSKLEWALNEYAQLIYIPAADFPMRIAETDEHFRRVPGEHELTWNDAVPGVTEWGHAWGSAWLKGNVSVPPEYDHKKLMLYVRPGAYEALLFVNGDCRGIINNWNSGIDHRHEVRVLTTGAAAGTKFEIALEAYASHPIAGTNLREPAYEKASKPEKFRWTFEAARIMVEDEEVLRFRHELFLLLSLYKSTPESSLRHARIGQGLEKVFQTIMTTPLEHNRDEWRPGVLRARKLMAPLLAARNGDTVAQVALMGHSHLDTAWLWTVKETVRKTARTFGNALEMIDLYPHYRFLQPASCHADMLRREYPALFERVRRAVAGGRWEPNGGMWVESDCNMTGGESLVRQFLYNSKFTRKYFDGYTADCCWHQDSFGYNANLPQIMKRSGCDYFLTTKLYWNDTTHFPYDAFLWRGIDGSEVMTSFIACHCWPEPDVMNRQWEKTRDKANADRFVVAYGLGDGGGGPQEHMIEVAEYVADLEGCPKATHQSLSQFMHDFERERKEGLPTYDGDLYLETHRGVFTSISDIKQLNRQCEGALTAAEIACSRSLRPYPAEKLEELWKKLSINQFHDILPGSSITEVNRTAIEELTDCRNAALAIIQNALGAAKAESKAGLFNRHGWEFAGTLHLPFAPKGLESQKTCSFDCEEEFQVAGLRLPGFGMTELVPGKAATAPETSSFSFSGRELKTPWATLRFDESQRITSLIEHATGRELVAAGGFFNNVTAGDDVPYEYDCWNIDADQKPLMRPQMNILSVEVVADGALEFRLRIRRKIASASTLLQDIVFYRDTPRIDFFCRLDWQDRHTLVKTEFNTVYGRGTARTEIPFGYQRQETHRNRDVDQARFEVCNLKYTDLSETGAGMALLNNGKYGIGILGGDLSLTLAKGGTRPDYTADAGVHDFAYAILPHDGFRAETVVRAGYEFNYPPVLISGGGQTAGNEGFMRLDGAPSVIIETVKLAESGKGRIVRLYESGGGPARTTLTPGVEFREAWETNLIEDPETKLETENGAISLAFHAFEIKTLLLK